MAEQVTTRRDNGPWVGHVFQMVDENGKQKYKYFDI